MKFFDLFKKTLKEERSIPKEKKTILLLDLDDALLKASPNMKIYRKLPTDKKEVALTPDEYANENVVPENKKYYSYRDFRDPKKVYESIVKGAPYINNLKIVDDFYNAGADLGVLTARGCEDIVAKAVKAFLKVKDKNGNLIRPVLPRERIHAVNDDDKVYPGKTDAEKKGNVMKQYSQIYDYVYLSDDDVKNRNNAIALKKESPRLKKAIRTIDAKAHRGEPGERVDESVIFEMALKDVNQEIIDAVNEKNYDKALILYFDRVKDQDSYRGLANVKDAFKKMLTFGITRTFGALEKKGTIPEGSAAALKSHGLANINALVDGSGDTYQNNPDYVAPKRASANIERKRLTAKTVKELFELLQEYKADGWKCNDENPREGSSKEKGNFVYVYISRPKKVEESEENYFDDMILEMAKADVEKHPDILDNIKNKNYEDALKVYFDAIKDQPTYEKEGSMINRFNHMIKYGLSRTFNAYEKEGRIPAGSTLALKKYAEQNSEKIAGKNEVSKPEQKVEKKNPKKESKSEYQTYDDSASGAIKKIADRVNKYEKLKKDLDDYVVSSRSIIPFIVDINKNGENGIVLGAKKPKIADDSIDNSLQTKSERYIAPMLDMRKRLIPDFIQKAAEKNFSRDTKKNLEKAETLGREYFEATKNKAYAQYMSNFLVNIIEGLKDFNLEHKGENLTDKEVLDELKSGVDFPYSDFVKLDRWFKTARMEKDKALAQSNERVAKPAAISNEIYKVRNEYISFVNLLGRAIASNQAAEFLLTPGNYAIVQAFLDSSSTVEPKVMRDFIKNNGSPEPEKELLPTLKNDYAKRSDENFNPQAGADYVKLSNEIKSLKENLENANPDEAKVINNKLSKIAAEISNVVLDRLIGLDILIKSSNSGMLDDAKKAAERYKKIKAQYLKSGTKKSTKVVFDPKSDKYKQYYDPEGEAKEKKAELGEMYNEVLATLRSNMEKVVENKLQKVLVNLVGKKYSFGEMKKMYDAMSQSPDELFKLLSTTSDLNEKR